MRNRVQLAQHLDKQAPCERPTDMSQSKMEMSFSTMVGKLEKFPIVRIRTRS